MEPLIVVPRGDKYMLIAGERRWRASNMAGVKEVPVRILNADDQKVAELSLLENLQREDLSIVEEAQAYQGLIERGLSQEEIARKMGMKQPWRIQERLNLLKLSPIFQEYALKGILTPSQAQEMSRLPKHLQGDLFDKISAGKAETYNKLRSVVNAMIFVEDQQSFLPEPTKEEKEVFSKYSRMLDAIVASIQRSFNPDDLSVLPIVLEGATRENIERIDDILNHLNKIKRALVQSESTREVVEQINLTIH
jgi:ParB/RepB/Spo0J family partition protein